MSDEWRLKNSKNSALDLYAQRVFGMDPNVNRLSLLPYYTKKTGLVAPTILHELAKSALLPGAALRGGNVSPEDAVNFSSNILGAGVGKGLASPINAGALAGMGEIGKLGLPKDRKRLEVLLEQNSQLRQQLNDKRFKSREISDEEWSAETDKLTDYAITIRSALRKANTVANRGKIQPLFRDIKEIPTGTKIVATHGLSYQKPTRGTVVGTRQIDFEDGTYNLPLVDFGDGKRRTVQAADIHEVFMPIKK